MAHLQSMLQRQLGSQPVCSTSGRSLQGLKLDTCKLRHQPAHSRRQQRHTLVHAESSNGSNGHHGPPPAWPGRVDATPEAEKRSGPKVHVRVDFAGTRRTRWGCGTSFCRPYRSSSSRSSAYIQYLTGGAPWPQRFSLLGSTGSIGTQTLDIVAEHPDRFEIVALAAGSNVELLAEQVCRRPNSAAGDAESARRTHA